MSEVDTCRLPVAQVGDRLVGLGTGEVTTPSSYSDEIAVELSRADVEPSIALKVFSANEEASRFWRGLGLPSD